MANSHSIEALLGGCADNSFDDGHSHRHGPAEPRSASLKTKVGNRNPGDNQGVRGGDLPCRERSTKAGTVNPGDTGEDKPRYGGSEASERKRSATAATAARWRPLSPKRPGSLSALLIDSACSVVESTSRRRLTSHQIRVGAVRAAGVRSACDASHQIAISRQAVLPSPVGTPTSTGHRSSAGSRS